MNLPNNIFDEVRIQVKDFLPMLYWCFIKYQIDPASRQGVGGREDKIGSFIDRFSNQCVNWLIFNHILSSYSLSVDPDFFFYNEKSAKKCADILGVRKQGNLYPFTVFDKTEWSHIDGMPFIEIKSLRKDQNLASLGTPQYDNNHYYCYVETDFDEFYLLKVFEDTIFKSKNLMNMDPLYIKNNSKNIILNNQSLSKPKDIGSMRLINVIKGDEIKKHFLECPDQFKPYYLNDVISHNQKLHSKMNDYPIKIIDGKIDFDTDTRLKHIQFYISNDDVKEIHNKKQRPKSSMLIKCDKQFNINHKIFKPGTYRLEFKEFDRKRKETEYCNYKDALKYQENDKNFPKSSVKELIEKIIKITE